MATGLNKGDDIVKVKEYFDQDEPTLEKETSLHSSNEKFRYVLYKRWIQRYGSGYGYMYADKYDLFVLAFKNDKLYFWGNLDDFKRSTDEVNIELGTIISQTWMDN